jgi:indolepyruvate ferredoxin oxidoreductase, beta subunit
MCADLPIGSYLHRRGKAVKYDILIAGVGGQGVVLASRLLALAAMKAGFHVSTAETIGMSQREGSVSSHIRIGDEVSGSLIPIGQADLLLGLEPAETVRNLPFLREGGKVLVNTHVIPPASRPPGSPEYDPATLLSFLCANYPDIFCSDFTELAENEGTYRAANIAMLGAAAGARVLPFPEEIMKAVIDAEIPEKYRAVNRAAFEHAMKCIRFISGN